MILQPSSCLFFSCLLIFEYTAQALNLLDALRNSGASNFAASIEADSNTAALALSRQVQTVFAVPDDAFGSRLKRQETPAEEQQLTLQFSTGLRRIGDLNKRPGVVVPTKNRNAILGGKPQNVVTDTRNTTGSRVTKQEAVPLPQEISNTTLQIPLNIFSGLGDSVTITNGDILYDRGVIHIVDGFFTLPRTLSATTRSKGYTTWTALTDSSNLTAELDSAAGITIFIPTNAAFANKNVSSTDPATPSLMDGHVVPNFVDYLPTLKDGAKLVTQAGTTVTVTVRGNDVFLNNAKILASNLILENGVAHVLDQVLSFAPNATPRPAPPLIIGPFTSVGLSERRVDTLQIMLAIVSFAVCVMLSH